MGGQPWWYTTRFQESLERAFQEVQQREFQAGRYGVVAYSLLPHLPVGDITKAPAPGPDHASIEEARDEFANYDGTKTILDMRGFSAKPREGYLSEISCDELQRLFGTDQPTYEQVVAQAPKLFGPIGRAEGRSLVVYKDGVPDQIMFLGYSAD